jgi:RNA polymerase sigma factor (sigma-70 family)
VSSRTLSADEQISLVERLRAGDEQAEHEFVQLFSGRLHLMISARIHDRETARDLAQEALVAALSSLRKGGLREAVKLAAFVHGLGRNVANNYLRRRQSAPVEVALDEDVTLVAASADVGEERERTELALRAVRTLPASDREVLTLTLVDGLKPGDIARRLGETAEVVRTRKSRALKRVIAEVERLSRFKGTGH